MTTMILPANPAFYRSSDAFKELGRITWNLTYMRHISIGDIVYIYESLPAARLVARTIVVAIPGTNIPDEKYWVGGTADHGKDEIKVSFDLELDQFLTPIEAARLTRSELEANGLGGWPQQLQRMPEECAAFVLHVLADNMPQLADQKLDPADFQAALEQIQDGDYSADDNIASTKVRGARQRAFSATVKKNYGYRCAVTGITSAHLLVAGHIVPWSEDSSIRLDPSNGICLSPIADKAFEHGLLKIHPDLTIEIVAGLAATDKVLFDYLQPFNGSKLATAGAIPPNPVHLARKLELLRG